MKTQLAPESLESRIAPAAVSGLGDEFVGPAKTPALAAESPAEAAPAPITVDDNAGLPRSGNVDLGTVVHDIATVPTDTTDLSALSVAAAEAVRGAASTLDVLATSALSGEAADRCARDRRSGGCANRDRDEECSREQRLEHRRPGFDPDRRFRQRESGVAADRQSLA